MNAMAQSMVERVELNAGGDLSILRLFIEADIVVQAVMVALLLASVWCWAIIWDKSRLVRRLTRLADVFENSFWAGGSLDGLFDKLGKRPTDPMAATFTAGMREYRKASEKGTGGLTASMRVNLAQRVERVMHVTIGRELAIAEKGLNVLASTGAVAPFVGLFGTVWGIMNSFAAIAHSKNTSLAVVAPGIAEALCATALGLVAAIPAVLAYNKFAGDLARYADRLEGFSIEFSAILSRNLEQSHG